LGPNLTEQPSSIHVQVVVARRTITLSLDPAKLHAAGSIPPLEERPLASERQLVERLPVAVAAKSD
jgi:hypothetical protein